MIQKFFILVFIGMFWAVIPACTKEKPKERVTFANIKDVPDSVWDQLSGKKIFFGHQSVGYDLLEGVRDVMRDHPRIKLNIVESQEGVSKKRSVFVHSKIGKNADPKSKMDDFTRLMETGPGKDADIAIMKLCFVDILPTTDPAKVMEDYVNAMASLKKRHPRTVFLHFTVPLTAKQSWFKEFIKDLIGKMNFYDNVQRNVFNDMVRQRYLGKEPLFDIAAIESTLPDGSRSSFTKKDRIYYSLFWGYTHDGGHLNEKGRRVVAEQLLVSLAQLGD